MSPLTEPTRLTLAKAYVGIDDPDAANYIALVEAADTAAGSPGGLETATKVAIHSFVKGCKADGIWPAIKASCILAGARTLNGALVPLRGTAPTNNNFVSEDYNRKTGLVGDGSTKYLDSNRNNNADPQDSKHIAVYASSVAPYLSTLTKSYVGIAIATGSSHLSVSGSFADRLACRVNGPGADNVISNAAGFIGARRNQSTGFAVRSGSVTSSEQVSTSTSPASGSLLIFDGVGKANARLAFYSIGEALNLALLDARVTDLITAIGAAIP